MALAPSWICQFQCLQQCISMNNNHNNYNNPNNCNQKRRNVCIIIMSGFIPVNETRTHVNTTTGLMLYRWTKDNILDFQILCICTITSQMQITPIITINKKITRRRCIRVTNIRCWWCACARRLTAGFYGRFVRNIVIRNNSDKSNNSNNCNNMNCPLNFQTKTII